MKNNVFYALGIAFLVSASGLIAMSHIRRVVSRERISYKPQGPVVRGRAHDYERSGYEKKFTPGKGAYTSVGVSGGLEAIKRANKYKGLWEKKTKKGTVPSIEDTKMSQGRLSLSKPVKFDSYRTSESLAQQQEFLDEDFEGGLKWKRLYYLNWPLFIATFPFAYYSTYREYPPIYYDYYQTYKTYPKKSAEYERIISGKSLPYERSLDECFSDCAGTCTSECQSSSKKPLEECENECGPVCSHECIVNNSTL